MNIQTSRVLVLALLLPSIAIAQDATDYASRAREAIEKELRRSGKPVDEFRIEILGEPNLLARHQLLHRPATDPPPGRAILSGRAVNDHWEVVAGARLLLTPLRNAGTPISVVTTTTGEFEFPDVPEGDHQLRFDGGSIMIPIKLEEGRHRIVVSKESSRHYSLFTGEETGPTVFAKAYRQNQLETLYQVRLAGSDPSIDAMDMMSKESPIEGAGSASLPNEAESKQLRTDIAPFLAALLDVTRGPERFKPFLSSRVVCRIYNSGERQIPTIDEQRCAMNLLDSLALGLWFQIEGAGEYPGSFILDWYKSPRGATEEELVTATLNRHEVLRNELRAAGMFEPEHSSLIQRYFRSQMADIPMARFRISERVPEFPLPDGELYVLPLPAFLTREGDELRVIGVFLAGG